MTMLYETVGSEDKGIELKIKYVFERRMYFEYVQNGLFHEVFKFINFFRFYIRKAGWHNITKEVKCQYLN